MNQKILIVEDEPLIARDLAFILEDMGITSAEIAMSYEDAIEVLDEKTFDLILLDVNLSSTKDGIDLAAEINENHKTPFIFITSYYNSSTVNRAKVTNPLAYLLKPFNQHDIRINVEMALYKVDRSKEDAILYIKEQTGTIQLELASIRFLEAQDNYAKVVCSDKELLISQTLKSLLSKLPETDFVRTHKSYAVRIDQISMIKGGYIFISDYKIPIGRSHKADFQKQISLL